ncbi:uncharacterized protein LOC128235592 [Mya arenaria]|uniref:uncharacterized protein LOC128235592 n=1 Tax=Mya arenaria TaxID=6604 RepID=UPI0022E4114B|nr:uncharacterized protein LOC128235592 [Mya arenaria]
MEHEGHPVVVFFLQKVKQRTFQYFEAIDEIITKGRDITPKYTSGTGFDRDMMYFLKKNLKCCNVDVQLEQNSVEIALFAEIANNLAGKVNLCLNAIDCEPLGMLAYPLQSYHVAFPSGRQSGL